MTDRPQTADVLILGQGLAGSALAWRLAERGVSAIVIDRGGVDEAGRPCASRVAAGLITPITGKRLTLAPGFAEQREAALAFYRAVEQRTGVSFLVERPAIRLLASEEERTLAAKRLGDREYAQHAELIDGGPHGALVMPTAIRLRVGAYLDATRQWLEGEGRFVEATVDPGEIDLSSQGVTIDRLGLSAACLILCQGYTPAPPAWTADLKLLPAKGEVLTVELPEWDERRVVHGEGGWVAPDESNGSVRYRVGSTHTWDALDSTPTAAAREELLVRLAKLGAGEASVVEHSAAVRNGAPDRRPVWGWRAEEPRVGWLNGLGSKGSLWAPWFADRLAKKIAQEPLDSP